MGEQMKQRDFTPCLHCGKGVMHSGVPLFYRITVERFGMKLDAVRRAVGLEMMLGGHGAIAQAMGPDEDLATPIGDASKRLLCQECAVNPMIGLAVLLESKS